MAALLVLPSLVTAGAPDDAPIRALVTRVADLWNTGNGEQAASPFAEDGELIAGDGSYHKGRADIARFYTDAMTTTMKGSRFIVSSVDSIRFIKPDVAVVFFEGGFVMAGETEMKSERRGRHMVVATRDKGTWEIAALQRTRILPPPAAAPTAASPR